MFSATIPRGEVVQQKPLSEVSEPDLSRPVLHWSVKRVTVTATTGTSTRVISLPPLDTSTQVLFPLLQIRMGTLVYPSSRHAGLLLVLFPLSLTLWQASFPATTGTQNRPPLFD